MLLARYEQRDDMVHPPTLQPVSASGVCYTRCITLLQVPGQDGRKPEGYTYKQNGQVRLRSLEERIWHVVLGEWPPVFWEL